jgi:hypothetical protein
MVALQNEESTAKSDSAQCRGSSLLLVPLRPNLAVQCQLLEDLLGGAAWPLDERQRLGQSAAIPATPHQAVCTVTA